MPDRRPAHSWFVRACACGASVTSWVQIIGPVVLYKGVLKPSLAEFRRFRHGSSGPWTLEFRGTGNGRQKGGEIPVYSETTRSIRVTVRPQFLEDQSAPAENHYVWAYHIRIENQGTETVRLRSRYWHITDAAGRVQEVRGDGVVGEQPVLKPGESFEYTSGTPLTTPSGIMVGTYHMETASGERFDVRVPAFSLDSPHERMQLN